LKILYGRENMRYEEIKSGMKVKSLRPFNSVPEGSNGEVVKFYKIGKSRGITIIWHGPEIEGIKDGFNEDELESLEFIN
jgi:hypothetical protein